MNEQPMNDIFSFDPNYEYHFVLVDKIELRGFVVEAADNGIVLNNLEHIPTDKIIFFKPVVGIQKDETA